MPVFVPRKVCAGECFDKTSRFTYQMSTRNNYPLYIARMIINFVPIVIRETMINNKRC